jgi:hypothetical protein
MVLAEIASAIRSSITTATPTPTSQRIPVRQRTKDAQLRPVDGPALELQRTRLRIGEDPRVCTNWQIGASRAAKDTLNPE